MGRRNQVPGRQPRVERERRRDVDVVLGLHGAEDLGNGYKAIFTLESFFRAQNGQFGRFQGDTFFARNAYVGIDSPYGTVTAGRLTTHLFLSTILFNPFYDSYTFSPMVYHVFLGLGTFPTYPSEGCRRRFGLEQRAVVHVAFVRWPEFRRDVRTRQPAGDNGSKKWSAQFNYANGPFAATATST